MDGEVDVALDEQDLGEFGRVVLLEELRLAHVVGVWLVEVGVVDVDSTPLFDQVRLVEVVGV